MVSIHRPAHAIGASYCAEMQWIGEGRTADIFRTSDGDVLKLYFEQFERSWVENAFDMARSIHAAGVPSPAVYEIVESNGRIGIIMEYLDGLTVFDALIEAPQDVEEIGQSLGSLHVAIHSHSVLGLRLFMPRLHASIGALDAFPQASRDLALRSIEKISGAEKLRHGDFHPGNIMIVDGQAIAFDWDGASVGPPMSDVTRAWYLLSSWALAPGPYDQSLIMPLRPALSAAYLDEYLAKAPGTSDRHDNQPKRELRVKLQDEMEQWKLPIAMVRLCEPIEEERELVINQVNQLLG